MCKDVLVMNTLSGTEKTNWNSSQASISFSFGLVLALQTGVAGVTVSLPKLVIYTTERPECSRVLGNPGGSIASKCAQGRTSQHSSHLPSASWATAYLQVNTYCAQLHHSTVALAWQVTQRALGLERDKFYFCHMWKHSSEWWK